MSEPHASEGIRERKDSRRRWEEARLILFAAIGLALPFYAFPVVQVWGRPVDLATILAAALILSSVPALLRRDGLRPRSALFGAAMLIPLLALLAPRPAFLDRTTFLRSYAHWLLVVLFFLCAMTLRPSIRSRRRLLVANVCMAALVAAFGLYQAIGIPRHWPLTGPRLIPLQREDFRFMPLADYIRPTSFFLEASWLGGYLVWSAVLAVTLFFSAARERSRVRFFWVGTILLLGAALLATLSLGALADGLTAAVILLFLLGRARRLRARPLLSFAALAVVLAGVFLFSAPGRALLRGASDRFHRISETSRALREASPSLVDSTWIRIRNLQSAVQLFSSRPMRGIGLGQFVRAFPPETPSIVIADPWCGWLTATAEMGAVGGLFLASVLVWLLSRWRSLPLDRRDLAVPALLAVAFVQQFHTASFIDLWWWYPVSFAGVLTHTAASDSSSSAPRSAVSSL